MQRVTDLADPRRCRGASVDGQCQNVAEEGAPWIWDRLPHDRAAGQTGRGADPRSPGLQKNNGMF
jgi:hypothetical protein